jgi:hypothetical protein
MWRMAAIVIDQADSSAAAGWARASLKNTNLDYVQSTALV